MLGRSSLRPLRQCLQVSRTSNVLAQRSQCSSTTAQGPQEHFALEGVFREVGISNVKTIREKRYIPAILYRGRGFPDIPFCLKLRDIEKLSQDPGFMAMLFKLVIRPPRDDEGWDFTPNESTKVGSPRYDHGGQDMVQCAFPWQVNWDRIKLVPDKIKFKPYYPDEQVERFVPVHLVGMEDNEYLKRGAWIHTPNTHVKAVVTGNIIPKSLHVDVSELIPGKKLYSDQVTPLDGDTQLHSFSQHVLVAAMKKGRGMAD